jgi:membrane-associated phospholipid phosphatase
MNRLKFTSVIIIFLCIEAGAKAQMPDPIYHVNRWVSGGIIVAGGAASLAAWNNTFHKPEIVDSEFIFINKKNIGSFDAWAVSLEPPANKRVLENYATALQAATALLPLGLYFDKRMQDQRLDLFFLYIETAAITLTLYQIGPLGPLFQDRYRPIVYYDSLKKEIRNIGYNRNSFYSGHVASAAMSSFFLAKVYTDYHPELGANKWIVFGAALLPPLAMGYIRLKELMHFPSDIAVGLAVGALCGVGIPEIHRLVQKHINASASASISTVSGGWSIGIAHDGSNWNIFFR